MSEPKPNDSRDTGREWSTKFNAELEYAFKAAEASDNDEATQILFRLAFAQGWIAATGFWLSDEATESN